MPQGWTHIVPQEVWPWLLIAAGVGGLGVIVLLISLIVRQRGPAPQRPANLTPAQQRTLERDVSNLISALSEMAQEVGTRLDERATRLESLIREADERLRRLEELSPESSQHPHMPPSAQMSLAEPDPRHADIYALADQGLGVLEIAQRLSRPKGEVELILALRPRRAG